MAARTSILKLGEAVKDGKGSWFIIVCIQFGVHCSILNGISSKWKIVVFLILLQMVKKLNTVLVYTAILKIPGNLALNTVLILGQYALSFVINWYLKSLVQSTCNLFRTITGFANTAWLFSNRFEQVKILTFHSVDRVLIC